MHRTTQLSLPQTQPSRLPAPLRHRPLQRTGKQLARLATPAVDTSGYHSETESSEEEQAGGIPEANPFEEDATVELAVYVDEEDAAQEKGGEASLKADETQGEEPAVVFDQDTITSPPPHS